jgi:hypothetical protein
MPVKGVAMGEVFVGVVEGMSPYTLTVGIIDDGQRVTANSFAVGRAHLHSYYIPQSDGSYRYEMPSDLFEFARFLNQTISPDSLARYLFEVPEMFPHPADEIGAIPYPVIPADSVILKIVILLAANGIIVAPFRIDSEAKVVVVLPILRGSDLERFRMRSPRFLPRGVCRAYGELLNLTCERPEYVAIVGALIAKNPGAFHYWSSIGRVQSSHDVVHDFRTDASGPRIVFSGMETYITDYTTATKRIAVDEIPLEYAVAEKKHQHLGGNDAIKAALIQVCREWRIDLRCGSMRADANEVNTEHPVYPLPIADFGVIAALEHAETARIWPNDRRTSS